MQIVLIDDDLIIRAKVDPADIVLVQKRLEANICFDAFDCTMFRGVDGKVMYSSTDTRKDDTS